MNYKCKGSFKVQMVYRSEYFFLSPCELLYILSLLTVDQWVLYVCAVGTLLKRLDLLRKEAREMDRQKRNVCYVFCLAVCFIWMLQFAAELEEVNHDLQRQKRLVQRSELASQQLKEELEMTAKSSQKNSQAAAKATDHQQEINKYAKEERNYLVTCINMQGWNKG